MDKIIEGILKKKEEMNKMIQCGFIRIKKEKRTEKNTGLHLIKMTKNSKKSALGNKKIIGGFYDSVVVLGQK